MGPSKKFIPLSGLFLLLACDASETSPAGDVPTAQEADATAPSDVGGGSPDGVPTTDTPGPGSDEAAQPDGPGVEDATEPVDPIPPCEGGILDQLNLATIKPPTPGSNTYQHPDEVVLERVPASIRWLHDGYAAKAVVVAGEGDYEMCRGTGEESDLILWRPDEDGTGRAWFVLRDGPARPLIVETPHPAYDTATLDESVLLFESTGARVLLTAGTHRCASHLLSNCDGTTGVCGFDDNPYRASDAAHSITTVFQAVHVELSEHYADDLVVSVHGMSGAGVSLSDGTKGSIAADSFIARLAAELTTRFPDEPITSCNSYPGGTQADILCGTTNVQGRHLNGSKEPCTLSAKSASGRFIHLEQSKTVRAQPWDVAAAFDAVLPPAE